MGVLNGEDRSSPTKSATPARALAQSCLFVDDLDCIREQANQQATEDKLEQLRREEVHTRAVMMEHAEQQQRTALLAEGLDPDTGQGFWCFRGTVAERLVGECRRSQDECIDRLLWRERTGMEVPERRCQRHAQAACFRLTRTLQEGERFMCFDELPTCELLQGTVDGAKFASPPSECEIAS